MLELIRRCIATSKTTGARCNRAPILGGSVCSMHGGKAPLAVAAAKQRLLAMVEPALDALLRALQSGSPCAVCGRSDDMGLVVRAAQIVLDRAGHGPAASLTLKRTPTMNVSLSLFELADRAERLALHAREAADREAAPVMDGYLVPEDGPVDALAHPVGDSTAPSQDGSEPVQTAQVSEPDPV